MKKFILTAIFLIFLFGCIPAPYSITPSVKGKVLDRESKEPIAGAKIYVQSHPGQAATTDDMGTFELMPKKESDTAFVLGVPLTVPHRSDRLVINAEGYKELISDNIYFHPHNKKFQIIDFELEKSKMP